MTLVATFDAPNSRVQLVGSSIISVSGMPLYVERQAAGSAWEPVRGGFPVYESGGSIALDDYEFVPNVQNDYRIRAPFVFDNFNRNVSNSFGTSSSGDLYTLVGGAAADFDVVATRAEITGASTNVHRYAFVNTSSFTDMYVDTGISVSLSTGASIQNRIISRRIDANNFYYTNLSFGTDGLITLSIRKLLAGVETVLVSIATGITYTSGVLYRVRFTVNGNRLSAKIWGVSDDEPGLYQASAVDSSLVAPGANGVGGFRTTGNTDANAISYYDNLHINDLATLNQQFYDFGTDDVTPMQDTVWLKFPLRPFLNREIDLCNWSEESIPARGAVFEVLGRRLPVATNDLRGSRRFEAVVRADDVAEAEGIRYSLSFGDIVFLQTPGPETFCARQRRRYPQQGYFYIDETTYTRPVDGVATITIDLPMTEVDQPDPTLVAANSTWQGIIAAFATWADVLSNFSDWASVLSYLSDPMDEEVG